MDDKCFYCGHDYSDHRSGGLCELCMPAGDLTGSGSACQCFAKPPALSAAEAEALALRNRVAELEAENETVVDDLQRMGAAFAEEVATLEARIRELETADLANEGAATLAGARITDLEAEVEAALRGQVEISESNGRMFDKLQERARKQREALERAALSLESLQGELSFDADDVAILAAIRALLKEE